MDLPEPMICRKLRRRFFEVKIEDNKDYEKNWIPSWLYE